MNEQQVSIRTVGAAQALTRVEFETLRRIPHFLENGYLAAAAARRIDLGLFSRKAAPSH